MVCGEIWLEPEVPDGGAELVEGAAEPVRGPVRANGPDAVWLVLADWVDDVFDIASDCRVSQRDDAAPRAINMTRTPTRYRERRPDIPTISQQRLCQDEKLSK
jgi:hypothetical protein